MRAIKFLLALSFTQALFCASSPIDITQPPYNAKCDGYTDDYTAITNAFNDAYQYVVATSGPGSPNSPFVNGASVYFPKGICVVSQSLRARRGVRVIGQSMFSTLIKAKLSATPPKLGGLAQFPNDTPVILMYNDPNDSSTTPLHSSSFEHLSVDCSGIDGCTGFDITNAQEGSYVKNVEVFGFQKYGFWLRSYGIQNFRMDHLWIFTYDLAPKATAMPIYVDTIAGRTHISDVTMTGCLGDIQACGTPLSGAGIYNTNSQGLVTSDIHCEYITTCIYNGPTSIITASDVFGSPTVPTLVQLAANSTAAHLENLVWGGSPTVLKDDRAGNTYLASNGNYVLNLYSTSLNGTRYITNSVDGKSRLQDLYVMGDMRSNAFNTCAPGIQCSSLERATDNANLLRTQSKGIILRTYGMGTSEADGGLSIVGGGYANDPAAAVILSGASGDAGTYVARSSTSSGVTMYHEGGTLYGNNGLTSGSIFTPNTALAWSSKGVQLWPKSSDPGCSSTGAGLLWFDASSSSQKMKVCINTGSGYTWKEIVFAP